VAFPRRTLAVCIEELDKSTISSLILKISRPLVEKSEQKGKQQIKQRLRINHASSVGWVMAS